MKIYQMNMMKGNLFLIQKMKNFILERENIKKKVAL